MRRRMIFGGLLAIGLAFSLPLDAAETTGIYIRQVLSGDLSDMQARLADAPKADTTRQLRSDFTARFIARTDGLALDRIDDPLVRDIARYFQDYWRDALMEPAHLQAFETTLKDMVAARLEREGLGWRLTHPANVLTDLAPVIEARGYGTLVGGRTQPLLELMLWRDSEEAQYDVQLSDRVQTVDVTFLDGFISRGWSSFATMGRAGTGGWAAKDRLFCIRDVYDLDSEKFKVSYLKHEARHFADYTLYPKLGPADLEYRGKLTELIFADETQLTLLTRFDSQAAPVATAPHSLANWHLVRNLRQFLAAGDTFDWKHIPGDKIREAARVLLDDHNRSLRAAGAASTPGVLAP